MLAYIFISPLRQIDLSNEYWLQVFEPSINAWQSGQTPNPDVSCNREIKFGALMNRVLGSPSPPSSSGRERGRKFLATGHYARVDWTEGGRTKLLRSADMTKDQTYYLSSVPEAQLSRVSDIISILRKAHADTTSCSAQALFPLAGLKKTEVRELAKKYGLPTASRQESMGVCFIGERGRFGDFICTSSRSPSYLLCEELTCRYSPSSVHRRARHQRKHRHFRWHHRRPT